MKGLDEFLNIFGHITVSQIIMFLLAITFIILAYKKFHDYLIKKHEMEKKKNAEISEALEATRKYPEYRQQSIKIQQLLESEIQETRKQNAKVQSLLEEEIQELRLMIQEDKERLARMEEQDRRRECNKLRDTLLQNYRYYTDQARNPLQSWTKMEAEAFWELFRDYEDLGGDGYMHSEVQPAMERLNIIEVGKK